jgi:hypothetical protein
LRGRKLRHKNRSTGNFPKNIIVGLPLLRGRKLRRVRQ